MKLSTQTHVFSRRFGDEKAIRLLAEIGYDMLDYSMFANPLRQPAVFGDSYLDICKNLKKTAEDCGVGFNQTHAPFPSYKADEEDYNSWVFGAIVRAIEVTSLIGAKIVIVHPTAAVREAKRKEFNLEFFNRLQPYCETYGVKVALENMFGSNPNNGQIIPNVCSFTKEFCEYLDELDSRYFTACLDVGHSGLVGETAQNMIVGLGHDRLQSLHVHDNNFLKDLHTLPFTQSMDWKSIMLALREIDYTGDFTFEADSFLAKMPDELLVPASRFMFETGKVLISWFETGNVPDGAVKGE